MRSALWTTAAVLAAVAAGCGGGGDDKPASDAATTGAAPPASGDLVACLEQGGFKQGSLPVTATEVDGAENVGEFVIPGTDDDYLIVYETASAEDAEAKASAYFGTGINGAAPVGKRFYAYTTDAPPVQPAIESCLSAEGGSSTESGSATEDGGATDDSGDSSGASGDTIGSQSFIDQCEQQIGAQQNDLLTEEKIAAICGCTQDKLSEQGYADTAITDPSLREDARNAGRACATEVLQ